LHSFELIKGRSAGRLSSPDRLNINRFNRLCEFLSVFSELDPAAIPEIKSPKILRSRPQHTIRRYAEQIYSRFF